MDAIDFLEILKKETLIKKGQRVIALATQSDDYPKSRNVIIRDFQISENRLRIYTHGLSAKVEELNKNPKCSLLWYHPKKKIQIQFYANAQIIDNEKILQSVFSNVSDHSKKDYYGPKPGLDYLKNKDEAHHKNHFCIIDFKISRYILLKLDPEEHLKLEYASSGIDFTEKRLIP